MLGNFHAFFVVCWLFLNKLFRKIISGTLSECQMVWIQIRTGRSVGPDLGPNCLQRLSAEDKSHRFKVTTKLCSSSGVSWHISWLNQFSCQATSGTKSQTASLSLVYNYIIPPFFQNGRRQTGVIHSNKPPNDTAVQFLIYFFATCWINTALNALPASVVCW